MLHRYRGGVVPAPGPEAVTPLASVAAGVPDALEQALGDGWDPRVALDAVFAVVRAANRSVEETRPWQLARAERDGDAASARRLDATLWELAEALRIVAEALRPLLPDAATRMAAQLGVTPAARWTDALRWGGLHPGTRVAAPAPLFPRHKPGRR
jgi:methionyl-tRNA synthetase